MPRYAFNQTAAQSCGASCIMVTLAELGVIPAGQINGANEQMIWQNVRELAGPSTSPASYVMNFFVGQGRQAHLYEDQGKIGDYIDMMPAMAAAYGAHRDLLQSTGNVGRVGTLQPTHLMGNGHVMLVVIIAASGLTHYVLARQEHGVIYIMNPDGATDTEFSQLFGWVNGPAAVNALIGNVNYMYGGMFIHIT